MPAVYERSLEEIAALFDTIYVSFYKDLGGIAGSGLAGPEDVIAEAKEWRLRHGGTLFAMWPYAASAAAAIETRLPRMKIYRDHALALADPCVHWIGCGWSPTLRRPPCSTFI